MTDSIGNAATSKLPVSDRDEGNPAIDSVELKG
jgi:hypothetical protein